MARTNDEAIARSVERRIGAWLRAQAAVHRQDYVAQRKDAQGCADLLAAALVVKGEADVLAYYADEIRTGRWEEP